MSFRSRALALVMLVVALPGVAAAQNASLRIGLPALPPMLDPATAIEGAIPFVSRQVFDTLVQYREGSSDEIGRAHV